MYPLPVTSFKDSLDNPLELKNFERVNLLDNRIKNAHKSAFWERKKYPRRLKRRALNLNLKLFIATIFGACRLSRRLRLKNGEAVYSGLKILL